MHEPLFLLERFFLMMKKKVYILVLILLCVESFSQNLIQNYSFEDTLDCAGGGGIDVAIPWFKPTPATSDYFNIYICTFQVPSNPAGFQYARTGNAYGGAMYWAGSNYREYIEGVLIDSLQQGKIYCVEFHLSLGNNSIYATDRIGAVFSKDSIISNSTDYLPYIPDIINPKGNIISDTAAWVLISGVYVAGGGEIHHHR